ncbi:TPA: hypothetical protein ACS5Y8_004469 [Salmonella enterica]
MNTDAMMTITAVKKIERSNPLWSHYLKTYIHAGYMVTFKCESPFDEWDTYESIADYFDVVGDFDCVVNREGRLIYMSGTCVFPLGEPVLGEHKIPNWHN